MAANPLFVFHFIQGIEALLHDLVEIVGEANDMRCNRHQQHIVVPKRGRPFRQHGRVTRRESFEMRINVVPRL